MTIKKYPQASLACKMQNDEPLQANRPYHGVLRQEAEGRFRFEETITERRAAHCPKLYSGRYVSLSLRQDGGYSVGLKSLTGTGVDGEQVAWKIYTEMLEVFKIIG